MTHYKAAGVNIEAGYKAVDLMKKHIDKTKIPGVLSKLGSFGGMFEILGNFENPVLVSGTDGVGTKLKFGFILNKHDTIGIDCVAMCVNDVICSGAKPLFFLDYIAVGKNEPEKIADIVKGIAEGCVMSECALIGGETAEMPGFYSVGEYDIAGFCVGIIEKSRILKPENVDVSDVLIGISSSGIHSNGFSLIRKMFNINGLGDTEKLQQFVQTLGCRVGEELLKPTKIYVKPILNLLEKFNNQQSSPSIKGISHITGGGFIENIPRMLPENVKAVIDTSTYPKLPVFNEIQQRINISKEELYNTFNMGIGMVLAVCANQAENIIKELQKFGEDAYIIGSLIDGYGIEII